MSSKCTGAGKSSVVGALLRLTEIEAGQILIDSMDIRNVRLARLRSAVSVVPQSAFLFEVSLLAGFHMRAAVLSLVAWLCLGAAVAPLLLLFPVK